MISHNKEFYSSVCKEEWALDDGKLMIQGVSNAREMKAVARKKKYEKEADATEILEKAGGNLNANGDKYKDATVNFWGQTVSKKEARQYEKAKKNVRDELRTPSTIENERQYSQLSIVTRLYTYWETSQPCAKSCRFQTEK